MSLRGARRPHLVQDDGHAGLGDLPGRFRSGEAATDDMDRRGEEVRMTSNHRRTLGSRARVDKCSVATNKNPPDGPAGLRRSLEAARAANISSGRERSAVRAARRTTERSNEAIRASRSFQRDALHSHHSEPSVSRSR